MMLLEQRSVISCVIIKEEKNKKEGREKMGINKYLFYFILVLMREKKGKPRRPDNNLFFFCSKENVCPRDKRRRLYSNNSRGYCLLFSLSFAARSTSDTSFISPPPSPSPSLSAVPCAQFIRQRGKKAQWAGLVSHFPPFNRLYFLLSILNLRSTRVVSV